MNKWILLVVITILLLLIGHFFDAELGLTSSYFHIVSFFAIQTVVLFRLDQWAPDEWKVQISLVKIVIRLLTSLVFITVLLYTREEATRMVIEFIIAYLIFMIFEIAEALTNLRRN